MMVLVAALVAAAAAGLASVAANAATGGEVTWWPSWLPSMDHYFLWWLLGSIPLLAGAALFGWWAQRHYERDLIELIPAPQRPESWMVDRPAEVREIVQAVLHRRDAGKVGITAVVHGVGGIGKTTVARLVQADTRVLRWFGGRVYWVTLGRDIHDGALAEKVNDLVKRIDASRAQPFTDFRQAAEHLAALLAQGPRRLIVLDDVWFDDQLAAFPVAGNSARLVTTRLPSLVAGQAVPIRVDQMSAEQARRVLTADLPELPTATLEGLLVETGHWPLLLRLTNRNLLAQAQSHAAIAVVADDLLQRLRRDGPLRATGQLPGVTHPAQLDISDPDQRSKALAATIEASAGLLDDDDRTRLTELAVFVEDEAIPVTLVATMWLGTAGLREAETRVLCASLANLALLTLTPTRDGGFVSLHDVVRDYLYHELGARLRGVHQVLLDAVAVNLPRVPAVCGVGSGYVVAWWQLPAGLRYLREHLVEHLRSAGRDPQADGLVADLRWIQSRLREEGPVGAFTDLVQISTPRAARLGRLLGQTAHLLTPTDPPHSLLDVLYSRVAHDPDWGPQAEADARSRTLAALTNDWPLPDLPDGASRRVIRGPAGTMYSVAIAPDGTWLATVSDFRSVRLWDATTGAPRVTLTRNGDLIFGLAISPDGTWLATGERDGTVRLWDSATGAVRATLSGHTLSVNAVAISSGGTWLAAAGDDGAVRMWDAATGAERATLTGHIRQVRRVRIAPDDSWLAIIDGDGTVRLWDTATGAERVTLNGHTESVLAVAIAPDGRWLATASQDRTVRLWDAVTGAQQASLTGHNKPVNAVAISPDGRWLASGGSDGTVRLWDATTGAQRARRDGHTAVYDVAISSDGTWLATACADGTVRLWDSTTAAWSANLTEHAGPVIAMAIAPDGTWLATVGVDRTVQLWDMATGAQRATLSERLASARGSEIGAVADAVAIASNSTWLATACDDGTVRMWDTATGAERATLTEGAWGTDVVAIAPDGSWLATAGRNNGTLRLWDLPTGTERTALTVPENVSFSGVAVIAPDGTWLATAGRYEGVWLWDTATGAQRAMLSGHNGSVQVVTIAPDGTWLAAAVGPTVHLWDTAIGARRATLTAQTWRVKAVAIAPDGTWLATTGEDGTVELWDTATGARRAKLTSDTEPVNAVAISPDGTWLATVGNDRILGIWHVDNSAIVTMMRTDEHLSCCAWSPRGDKIIVGGTAGLYRFAFKPPNS